MEWIALHTYNLENIIFQVKKHTATWGANLYFQVWLPVLQSERNQVLSFEYSRLKIIKHSIPPSFAFSLKTP